MSYRPQPKYATSDATRGPWTTCDVCGFIWQMCDMQFQYDYLGGSVPQSTGYLKCPKCLDQLNQQRQLIIIPPDPPPLFNTRPENYTVDETNWLVTDEASILVTDTSEQLITSIPNPDDSANTCYLTASLIYSQGSTTSIYIDLFLGNPASGGTSVLRNITGSSTRTNYGTSFGINGRNVAENIIPIIIASASAEGTNVNFIGVYSAASGGVLLASGRVAASGPLVQAGTTVAFDELGLIIDLN